MTTGTHDIDEIALIAAEAADRVLPFSPSTVHRVAIGDRLSALRWGDAPEALFLHGAGLNAHTWDATLLALGRSAVALDLPGHGHSGWRDDGDYRASTIAGAIAPLLDRVVDGRRVPVIGQSLGGAAAVALAAERPDLVSGLVLVDVSPGLQAGDAAQVRDFLAGPVVFSSREEIVDRAIAAGIGTDRAALTRGVLLNTRVRADGAVVFRHHLTTLPQDAPDPASGFADLWEPLAAFAGPVLLVRGSTGFLSEPVVEEFRRRLPRARVVEVDSGHNVQEQRPVALAAVIADALEAR